MWVSAASAARPEPRDRSSASRSIVPSPVLGTTSMVGPGQLADLHEAEVVAVVGDPVDHQAVPLGDAPAEDEAPQGFGPRLGVRAGHHHLAGLGAEQSGRPGPQRGQPVGDGGRGLVTPPVRLQAEVARSWFRRSHWWGRAAPALLRWATFEHPGVADRSAATSMGPVTVGESTGHRPLHVRCDRWVSRPSSSRGCGGGPVSRVMAMNQSEEPLRADTVDPDPLVQFGRWFDAAGRVVDNPEAMALATVDAAGRASVRMVLLKSWGADGFVFHTNYDSRKGHDLAGNPSAALLFYWEPLGRQVRIEGTAERTSVEESDTYFAHPAPRGPDRRPCVAPEPPHRQPRPARRPGGGRRVGVRRGPGAPPALVGGRAGAARDLRVLAEPGGPTARSDPVHPRYRGMERHPAPALRTDRGLHPRRPFSSGAVCS